MASDLRVVPIALVFLLGSFQPLAHALTTPPASPSAQPLAESVLGEAQSTLAAGEGPARGHSLSCASIGALSVGCADGRTGASLSGGAVGWARLCARNVCPPPGRGGAGMTYDPATGYVVLFGGINNLTVATNTTFADTWIFEKGEWKQLKIPGPVARLGEYMAYDYSDHYVLLFGGGPYLTLNGSLYYHDTWTFQNGTWTKLSLTIFPSARGLGGMVWDPLDGYLLMYGGMSSQTDIHSDTWTFSGGHWTNLTLATHPPPLLAPAMAYDQKEGYVLVFGGATPTPGLEFGDDLSYTWTFAHGMWTNLSSSAGGAPTGRILSSMAFDPAQNWTVLFGGWNTTSGALFGDTWIFVAGHWLHYFTSPAPSAAIIGASLISTTSTTGLLLFGGIEGTYSKYRSTNATWVFGPPPVNTTVSPNASLSTPYVVAFHSSPAGCSFDFNSSLVADHSNVSIVTGQYPIAAPGCPGYSFGSWFASGGVTGLGQSTNWVTTVDVVGNGTLVAYFERLPSVGTQVQFIDLALVLVGIAALGALTFGAYPRLARRRRMPPQPP